MKDQNASEHFYTRDKLGRVTTDFAEKDSGSSIDDSIDAITTEYDDLGRVEFVKSHADFSGTPTVENAVQFTYNGLGQVEEVRQDNDRDIGTALTRPTLTASYGYAQEPVAANSSTSFGNYSRMNQLAFPLGDVVQYEYGWSGQYSDDRISRLTNIVAADGIGYDYIGMGMVAIVDLASADTQLDRYRTNTGSRTAGHYPGFDKFGRVIHQLWAKPAFDYSATPPPGVANSVPFVQLEYGYDKSSNRTSMLNKNKALQDWYVRDAMYEYDGLDRLIKANRGKTGTPFDHVGGSQSGPIVPSQKWDLDMLGNWDNLNSDGSGNDFASGTSTEARIHNQANELREQQTGSGPTLENLYDHAGNMRVQKIDDGVGVTEITYTHDLWNRLVRVQYGEDPRSEFIYNGLNWRIIKRADTDASGGEDALDQERRMFYSANWQMIEEQVDDDWTLEGPNDIERTIQYVWGPRYIDDIVLRRIDPDNNGEYGRYEPKYYHLTDAQFSTVAIIDGAARLPRGHPRRGGRARTSHRGRSGGGRRAQRKLVERVAWSMGALRTHRLGSGSGGRPLQELRHLLRPARACHPC
jgi:hypothetical protein